MKMDLELLNKYFQGETTPEENEKILDWVEESPENFQIYIHEREVFDALLLNTPINNEDIKTNNLYIKPHSHKKYLLKEIAKIASIIVISVLATTFLIKNGEEDTHSMQTVSVPAGQRINIVLPDGTDVWLNAKTSIKYPASFNKKERQVEICGQAYFDVTKKQDIPFIVKTRDSRVKVLGTKFDIQTSPEGYISELMLMEGKVRIDMNESDESIILNPFDKANAQDGKFLVEHTDDVSPYEWRNGILSFKNKTFEEIMKIFEKVYDVQIIISTPELKNERLTAKFRTVDGVDYALKVLQRECCFKITEKSESITDDGSDSKTREIRISI